MVPGVRGVLFLTRGCEQRHQAWGNLWGASGVVKTSGELPAPMARGGWPGAGGRLPGVSPLSAPLGVSTSPNRCDLPTALNHRLCHAWCLLLYAPHGRGGRRAARGRPRGAGAAPGPKAAGIGTAAGERSRLRAIRHVGKITPEWVRARHRRCPLPAPADVSGRNARARRSSRYFPVMRKGRGKGREKKKEIEKKESGAPRYCCRIADQSLFFPGTE